MDENTKHLVYLPYADWRKSAQCFTDYMLISQCARIQLIVMGLRSSTTFTHLPSTRMWDGYIPRLLEYYELLNEHSQAYYNATAIQHSEFVAWCQKEQIYSTPVDPPWLGFKQLHLSHRAQIIRDTRPIAGSHYENLWPEVNQTQPVFWPNQYDWFVTVERYGQSDERGVRQQRRHIRIRPRADADKTLLVRPIR